MLWILQGLATLVYGASGIMKVFMFDKVSVDVPSFGALPKRAWTALGVVELICVACFILQPLLHLSPVLTGVAAAVLALESLVFIGVHVKYRETPAIIMVSVLGILMAVLSYLVLSA